MILFANTNKNITVVETKFEERLNAQFKFKTLFDGQEAETDEVTGACFVCAEKEAAVYMSHDNTVILDAFSSVGQFTHYDPVVWYAYCLWALASVGVREASCFGVKTDSKVFMFIGNYAEHVDFVKSSGVDTKEAVNELVTKPLGLYRNTLRLMQLDKDPITVINRSWHADIQTYMPLAYAHLLLLPSCLFYADVAYNDLLQGMIAFAVGQTKQSIIAQLLYTDKTTPIEHPDRAPSSTQAYKLLGEAHYALMMVYKFVIPENATQDTILFDAIEAGTAVQHEDHIAALCHVRYNWVFDTAYAPIWAPAQQLLPNAPYHAIDVHRHITHLQSKPGTPNDLTKRLSPGFYVTDNNRTDVIIFDVQVHGRADALFTGRNASTICDLMLREFAGARYTKTDKQKRASLYGAMKRYFDNPNDTQWSLCDMAYKYLVLEDKTDKIFMQDSYALTYTATQASCSRCTACPVCFIDPTAALDGSDTMHTHILDEHKYTYYMAPFPLAAAINSPGISPPGSTTISAANSASASVAASSSASGSASTSAPGSVPSVPSSTASFDPARTNPPSTVSNTSSEDAAFEAARRDTNTHIQIAKTELITEITHPQTASDTQAHLSEANYDALKAELAKEKAARAQDAADIAAKDTLIKNLNDNLKSLGDAIAAQTTTLALETKDKAALDGQLKALEQEHEVIKKQHEENKKAKDDENRRLEEEIQQQKDDVIRTKSNHATELRDTLQPVQDENEALKLAKATLEQDIAALEANNKEVAVLMRELTDKNAEIDALKKRIRDRTNCNTAARASPNSRPIWPPRSQASTPPSLSSAARSSTSRTRSPTTCSSRCPSPS
jgi:hypothetical protein